jgi:hypothetical protein
VGEPCGGLCRGRAFTAYRFQDSRLR